MAIDSFLHFFMNHSLVVQKITNWPDFCEGKLFEFFKKNVLIDSKFSPEDYFGTCWTLQDDDQRLFDSEDGFRTSCKEIRELGSAAMWEAYCKGGGLWIKTTVGKVLDVLRSYEDLWHGRIFYKPLITEKPESIEETLFHKRTCFRHEDEYRFIVRSGNASGMLDLPINNMRCFIDEMLVSPSRKENSWISRAIYKLVAHSNVSLRLYDMNSKDGKQYCRISQMYGLISEEV